MTQFLIAYIGSPKPSSPEEGQQHMARYMDWLTTLGDAVVSPANPIKNTRTVYSDGSVTEGSSSAISGYTIVEAESHKDAVSIAQSCPFLDVGGTLEVSELVRMNI